MPLVALPLKALGVVTAVYLNAMAPTSSEISVRASGEPTPVLTAEPVTVSVHDVNHDEDATIVIGRDGTVDAANDEAVRHLFRCRRTGKEREIDRRLLAMLADLSARYPGKTIEFVSGYRGHREESKTSPHRAGRALDLRIDGVRDTEIRDYLWRTHREVGVGWYPKEGFVHVDHREQDIAWTETHGNNTYHPSWSERARRADASPSRVARTKRSRRPNV
jgi:uncharacterized protein YcbK (DUF882 family)